MENTELLVILRKVKNYLFNYEININTLVNFKNVYKLPFFFKLFKSIFYINDLN